MKRICSMEEKELLYQNRKQMLQGINWTASHSRFGYYLASTLLALLVMFTVAIVGGIQFNLSKIPMWICMLITFSVAELILSLIFNRIRVRRETKAFLKQDNLMVNGATIVAMDETGHFLYIEDDFLDENGNPYIIQYPSRMYEMTPDEIGKRLLIMYADETRFQLVRLNDDLKQLIPSYSYHYPLTEDPERYQVIAHPNVLKITKEEKELSESEKEEFAKLYIKVVRSLSTKTVKKSAVALAVIGAVMCVLLDNVEGGFPLEKTVPIAVASYVGMIAFYWLMYALGNVNLRRQAQFTAMQEVVFHSYVFTGNSATVHVYEWVNGEVQVREYFAGNVFSKTAYGTVLYKFKNKKGKDVLLNTKPIGQ